MYVSRVQCVSDLYNQNNLMKIVLKQNNWLVHETSFKGRHHKVSNKEKNLVQDVYIGLFTNILKFLNILF